MTEPARAAGQHARLLRAAPAALALATVLIGIVDVISAVTPERAERLHALTQVVPLSVAQAASATTVVVGLALVLLAHALRRRKRRAWRAAVTLLLVSCVLHVIKGLDVEEASLTLLLVILLVVLRDQFTARGDPRTRWVTPVVMVSLLATSYVLGLALLLFQDDDITGHPGFSARSEHVLAGLVGVTGPVHFTSEYTSDVVFAILLALGVTTVLIPAYLLFRPAEPRARLTPDDESRIRLLLSDHGGRDSLAYFALRRDKAAVFSATGKAAVSYRVVSGVMLASGDPIGDPEAWPGALDAFLAEAAAHAWVPAVIGCSERAGEVWVRESGMRALELGDEAIVEVDDFTLEGRPMRNVRQTVNRVLRCGYTTEVRRVAQLSDGELAEIRTQAAAWRGAEIERGFSMALGRFGDLADPECVVVTAHDAAGLRAVLHFVPWGPDGLSLDLMRRDRDSDTGLNELMIVRLLEAAPALGVRRLSLNFAVFRSTLERGGRLGAGPVIRAWRGLLLFMSRWFQIESLYRFNAKFRPLWEPRFVCYPAARDLPRVALAALEAEAFIVGPRQWMRSLRRRTALASA